MNPILWYQEPNPFCTMLRATGSGEAWTHGHEENKFREFGWRNTTSESQYQNGKTLIGNWNEEGFDIEKLKELKPLPAQHAHYFTTTTGEYSQFHKERGVPESIKYQIDREPRGYDCHQPELDSQQVKDEANSWETTYRAAYAPPAIPFHMAPIEDVIVPPPPQIRALDAIQKKREEIAALKSPLSPK